MTYEKWMEVYNVLFFHLTPDALAAIANDLAGPDVPAILKRARDMAINEGRDNMGADEFDAFMAGLPNYGA